MTQTPTSPETFPTDTTGLETARPTEVIEIADGDTIELRIAAIANQVGGDTVRMLAYNGSVPGPTLRVRQGSTVSVRVRNDADHEGTVHWHGLRVDNAYDGVPYETQDPIAIGGEFTYELQFPDDGLYWYHPHAREDYGLEMGLYGNIIVDPVDAESWAPVNREAVVTLDDILLEDGRIAPFRVSGPTYTAMGRFGNVMLTGGATDLRLAARAGEVVRFFLTNTANTRIFNAAIAGARMKLVGGDSGRYEREEWVDAVLLSPSERAIVDVHFPTAGEYAIEHRTPERTYVLGGVEVTGEADESFLAEFETLHTNDEMARERERIALDRDRAPDKTLVFESLMPILYGDPARASAPAPASTVTWTCVMHAEIVRTEAGTCPLCGMKLVPAAPEATVWQCPMNTDIIRAEPGTCPKCGMKLVQVAAAVAAASARDDAPEHEHAHEHDTGDGLEWEDLMPEINARTDSGNMVWKLVDRDSGKENDEIDWSFRVGDRVKIRLENTMDSEHPMHHPFHIHGAGRFLVLERDGVPEPNLVWKDTVLLRAGETVDILLDVSNPGLWMAHCHIAEHNQTGMMFSFRVEGAAS